MAKKCTAAGRVVIAFVAFLLADGKSAWTADLAQWKALLHYQGGISQVVSPEFFLNPFGRSDFEAELETTISLLESGDGKTIACNYPARYLWIKDQALTEVNHDLDECPGLSDFVAGFQKDALYLLFASEYIDTPASAFGHLLLVFKDTDNPLVVADTLQFAAEPGDDPLFVYLFKGLSGGYKAHYVRSPFFLIQEGYRVIEQRTMNLFRLDLGPDRTTRLIYHLYELRKAEFEYHFVRENCAFQIKNILDVAFPEDAEPEDQALYVTPLEVVKRFRGHFQEAFSVEPTLFRAERIYKSMSPEEKSVLRRYRDGELGADDLASCSDKVKELTYLEEEYLFRRFGVESPGYGRMARMSFHNALPPPETMDLDDTRDGMLAGAGVLAEQGQHKSLFRWRLAGRDIHENQLRWLNESSLSLLDLTTSVQERSGVRLERLTLFEAHSMLNRSILSRGPSWLFHAGFDRENSAREVSFNLGFGLGRGLSGTVFGGDLLVEAGMQGNKGDGTVYLCPRADIIIYPFKTMKVGGSAKTKYGTTGKFEGKEVFISKDVGKVNILTKWESAEPGDLHSFVLLVQMKL